MPEKLDYMHNNPVKRGLVEKPGDWSRPRGIELEVLLPGSQFGAGDGSDAVIRDRIHGKNAMYAPPGVSVRTRFLVGHLPIP